MCGVRVYLPNEHDFSSETRDVEETMEGAWVWPDIKRYDTIEETEKALREASSPKWVETRKFSYKCDGMFILNDTTPRQITWI